MTPPPLRKVTIASIDDRPDLAWAVGETFSLPHASLEALAPGAADNDCVALRGTVPGDDAEGLRLHSAFTDTPPTSSRLPFPYHRVPSFIRAMAAKVIGRMRGRDEAKWARFPGWPLDLSADFLADVAGSAPRRPGPCPVILSHDLDSAEGLRNAVERFIEIEERFGARSVNFVVPCKWKLDHGLLGELHGRGHEIGVHGYDHANRTAFASPDEMQRRVQAARPLIEQYKARGYRAPSLLRTRRLYQVLSSVYTWDSSIPTSGGPLPVPNHGCASARPFRVEGLPVIPLSMPRDGSLRFLGHSPADIFGIWKSCAERIAASGGCVVLLTHCEKMFSGNNEMLSLYRDILDYLNGDDRFTWSTPDDVLAAYNIL